MKADVVYGDDTLRAHDCVCSIASKFVRRKFIADVDEAIGLVGGAYQVAPSEDWDLLIYRGDAESSVSVINEIPKNGLGYKLVIHVTDNIALNKDDYPSVTFRDFLLPKYYKLDDDASEFCIYECGKQGVKLSKGLASIIVNIVGNDLWYLRNEMTKLVAVAEINGTSTVKPEHVSKSVSRMGEYGMSQLCESVRNRDPIAICRELNRIEQTSVGDPTIKVCRFLFPHALRIFISSIMKSNGLSSDDISDELGINRWLFSTKMDTDKWGPNDSKKLLKHLSTSDKLCMSGSVSPWVYLHSGLLKIATR